jgi:hypothetical protein
VTVGAEEESGTSMDDRRNRSGLALIEIGAASLLIVALFLPWFLVTYLRDPFVVYTTDPLSTSISWVGHADYGQTFKNIFIPYGSLAAVGAAIAGLVLPGRGKVLALVAAFLIAGAGVVMQLSGINSGAADSVGFSATTPGMGLWLFGGSAALGTLAALIDLARGGNSTFISKAFGKPSSKRNVAAAGVLLAGVLLVLWGITGSLAAFYSFFAMLVALILSARALSPTSRARATSGPA